MPSDRGTKEVKQFLSHLAVDLNVAASTQNQAFCALLYPHQELLQQDWGLIAGVVRAKKPKRLPEVLTRDEVQSVLALLDGTCWLVCVLLYGSGLRLTEVLQLRVKDLDFERGELLIRDAKGQKDHVTMLPTQLLEDGFHGRAVGIAELPGSRVTQHGGRPSGVPPDGRASGGRDGRPWPAAV